MAALGGFSYGADALDNPTVDAPLRGATASGTITPSVLTLTKTYSGPENETATGPNYRRRYTIRADLASGQTVTDLRLIDFLPNNIAFLSLVSSTPAGAVVEQTPTVGAAANAPNNDLVVRFPSVTGGAGASDAAITIEYFVPRLDANSNAVISPTTGDDVTSLNDGRASGNWTPVDPSDAADVCSTWSIRARDKTTTRWSTSRLPFRRASVSPPIRASPDLRQVTRYGTR